MDPAIAILLACTGLKVGWPTRDSLPPLAVPAGCCVVRRHFFAVPAAGAAHANLPLHRL